MSAAPAFEILRMVCEAPALVATCTTLSNLLTILMALVLLTVLVYAFQQMMHLILWPIFHTHPLIDLIKFESVQQTESGIDDGTVASRVSSRKRGSAAATASAAP